MKFKIYLQSSSKVMTDREKEGRMEIQKFEYLKSKKRFLDEKKAFFIVFEGLSFGEKIKNSGHKL